MLQIFLSEMQDKERLKWAGSPRCSGCSLKTYLFILSRAELFSEKTRKIKHHSQDEGLINFNKVTHVKLSSETGIIMILFMTEGY